MSDHRIDPIYRRVRLRDLARARVRRRVALLLTHIEAEPYCTSGNCSTLRRLDDLLGEAGLLRSAL